ncbi:4Fe-4S binding protein [Methanolacinia paynteri]|uniref:4Fe-4S binding protein n=1 Tax=Methanolacinia paynteri TaxID=230356 RepID=UPI00064E737E|nr:4Fe-4S binding protein [Methanolacinia paynteri]
MAGKRIRRIIPAAAGAASLAVPACAAVCPKGIGDCPYPGRCFLYVDSNGDSICDYTPGDTSQAATDADPVTVTNSSATDSGNRHRGGSVADTVQSTVSPSGGTESSSDSGLNPLLFTASGLVIAGVLILSAYFILRYLRRENPMLYSRVFLYAGMVPLLLAVLIVLNDPESFGISGAFADMAERYSGIVYMFGGALVMAGLWLKNAVSREMIISVLILTTAAGFFLVLPIAPDGFYSVVSGLTTLQFAGLGFVGLVLLVCISLIFGRVFCAHMCPAGAVQELLSRLPLPKLKIRDRRIPNAVRLIAFAGLVAGALLSINTFEYIGVSHFFATIFSAAAVVFAVILVLSLFVYRPFCTFLCPYGLVFSIASRFGRFGLKRTEDCIDCGKCERVCPTVEAGRDGRKAECYLCGRCIEVCPKDSAIVFGKRSEP